VAFDAPTDGLAPATPLWWCIRPEQVVVSPEGRLEAAVVDVLDLGSTREIVLRIGGEVTLRGRGELAVGLRSGERCRVELPATKIAVWPRA
jgi:molybdate transport system permease protein